MSRSAGVCLLLGLLSVSGCANGRVGEQDTARGVVRTFLAQCGEQRVLRVLPTLVPAAQKLVADAGSSARGCTRVLGLPADGVPPAAAFRSATIAVRSFNGARAEVEVGIPGSPAPAKVSVSRGTPGWRIEAS